MFDQKRISEHSIWQITESILNDKELPEVILPQDTGARKDYYKFIFLFLSVIEYLDRNDGVTYGRYFDYVAQMMKEILDHKTNAHIDRCQMASDPDDYLVDAASVYLNDRTTYVTYAVPMLRLISSERRIYDRFLSHFGIAK